MIQALVIRIAMLSGVLIFGGVVWFMRRSDPAPAVDTALANALLWVGRGTWIVAIAGCLVVFALLRHEREGAQNLALPIAGWAMGELVALFGGVVWFLTGSPSWYMPGLVFLVMTFLVFPVRRTHP